MADRVREFLGHLSQLHKTQAAQEVSGHTSHTGTGKGHYRLGRLERQNRKHNPMAYSGDAGVMSSADLMHRRVREMYANQVKVKRPIDLIRDLVVGTGIHAFADPIDYTFGCFLNRRDTVDLHRSFDYALESDEKFLSWALDPKRCDVKGKQNFFQMQALCISETAKVGDGIVKMVYQRNPAKGEIPLKLQMIEKDQLDLRKDNSQMSNGHKIINGIEFDPDGYEIGIWVYDSHPNEHFGRSSTESTFVSSEFYLHFFKKNRPSQHVGATWLHALGQPVVNRNQYLETELRKAIKQAQHVLVHYSDEGGSLEVGMDLEYDDNPSTDVAMGFDPLAAQVGKDDKVELLQSSSPNPNADKFFDLIDTDMSNAANLSYYSNTGRFEKVNQSGFRGALQLEDAQMTPIKNAIGTAIVLPIRREFNRLAIAAGMITNITPSEYTREMDRFNRFDCIAPGRELLDPEMENDAALAKLRGGMSTLKIECAKRGLYWIHVLRQIKLENIICEELGIQLDHSKGQGGQNQSNTRSREMANGQNAILSAIESLTASLAN